MDRLELQRRLVKKELGVELESTRPVWMSIEQSMEALWPLNKRFQPHLEQIRSLAFDKSLNGSADAAIERYVLSGDFWSDAAPGVWRVLLERHIQVMQLLAVKSMELGGWSARFVPVPDSAGAALRSKLAIVFLLHSTPLPFPIEERANAELPQGDVPGSLTRH